MPNKKEIAIKDACILFDLVDLNLLEDFFQLDFIAITTPQVIAEITNETQWEEILKFLNGNNLKIDNKGELNTISQIMDQYPGLSVADSSVLELAIRKEAIIFSADGNLRKISTRKGLIVRGVLWIIAELYSRGIISKVVALEKLNTYSIVNIRAPKKEIQNLINKLSDT